MSLNSFFGTQLNGLKNCSYINKLVKRQSFAYTQLNDQTVQFQAIQFSIIHLFPYSLYVKQFYLTHI